MNSSIELPRSRLESLYKDFRKLKDLNYDGYRANINTWKRYLVEKNWNVLGKLSIQCGNELLNSISIDVYGQPICIDIVIDELVDDGVLVTSDAFFNSTSFDADKGSNSIGRLSNLFSLLGFKENGFISRKSQNTSSYLKEVKLLIKSNIEDIATSIQTNIKKNIILNAAGITDLIFDVETFKQTSGLSDLIDDKYDQDVMMFYLEHYTKIIKNSDRAVKIIDESAKHIIRDFDTEITDNDVRIIDVKSGISNMQRQIGKLEEDVKEIETKINSDGYKRLQRGTQKELLKSRIIAHRYLERLYGQKANLDDIKKELDISFTNKVMFDTLKQSNIVMKSVNSYIGSIDKVNELLDSIEEEGQRANELNEVLSESNRLDDRLLEEEVDKELAELELQLNKETEMDKNEEDILEQLKNISIDDTKIKAPIETPKNTPQETGTKELEPNL